MATIAFDPDAFRALFPGQFDESTYPDALLQVYWTAATCYVSADTYGYLSIECRTQVLYLVTAHLIKLADAATAGVVPGVLDSSSIDKISVKIQTFQSKSALQYFYFQTHYGMQAFAILHAQSAGGLLVGGRNELGAFRRSGGVFTPSGANYPATSSGVTTCSILSRPPAAPFDFDLGPISSAFVDTVIAVPAGCVGISLGFDGVGAAGLAPVSLSLWSGFALDSGERFNISYFDSDARQANQPGSLSATNQDATGETVNDGYFISGLLTGSSAANPNLVVVGGFNSLVDQVLNIRVTVSATP